MSKPPGRGWAAKIVTQTTGTVIGLSSSLRGYTVDGVYYRPAILRPMRISKAIPEPLAGLPVWDELRLDIEHSDWWIVDHLGEDRLEGASITLYREVAGTFTPATDAIFVGFVRKGDGVRASDSGVTLTCVDVRAFYLENATIGGERVIDDDEFPDAPDVHQGEVIPRYFGLWLRGIDAAGPALCYQDDATSSRYVLEDTHDADDANLDGGLLGSYFAVDTQPPTDEHSPDDPHSHTTTDGYVDLWHAVSSGAAFPIDDTITNTSGNASTFRVNKALWLAAFGTTFDPQRYVIRVKHGGAQTKDTTVLAAYAHPKTRKPIASALRLYIDHAGMPASYFDLSNAKSLDDQLPDVGRWIRSSESIAQLLGWLYEEVGIVERMTPAGLITWALADYTGTGTAVVSIETRHIVADVQINPQRWGDYFNAATAERDQGYPWDTEHGRGRVKKRRNADAIAANDGVEVLTKIEYHWLADGSAAKGYVDRLLSLQGKPNDTVSVTFRLDDSDLDDQLSVQPGDTIEFSYVASDVDTRVRTLAQAATKWLVLSIESNDDDTSTALLWRFGSSATAGNSLLVMMDGSETFPASLGGGSMATWSAGWSEAQKAYAGGFTGRVGGYLSDTGGNVLNADASDYARSYMG